MKTAKVFRSGNSIAVRIPKEFGLKEGEVYLKKEDNTIVIIPKESKWDRLYKELEEVPESVDFMKNRNQPELQEREIF
ncbi:antitoxin [Hydrogenivirga sp.]